MRCFSLSFPVSNSWASTASAAPSGEGGGETPLHNDQYLKECLDNLERKGTHIEPDTISVP